MKALAAVARLAAEEAGRNTFFFLLLLGLAGWISLLPLLLNFTFSAAETMVRDAALSLILVAGLAVAVKEGAARTATERETALADGLFATGLPPLAWAAGRWLGVLAASTRLIAAGTAAAGLAAYAARGGISVRKAPVLLAFAALAGALLFATRRAGKRGEPFPAVAARALSRAFLLAAAAGLALRFREGWQLARLLLPAAALLVCACAAAAALSVFSGSVARPAAAVAASAVLLAAGLLAGGAAGGTAGGAAQAAGRVASALLPDLQAFFPLDALAEGTGVPAVYLAAAAAYAALHAAAWLLLAAAAAGWRERS